MPESVRDRCTKAHEYLFLLSKRHARATTSMRPRQTIAKVSPSGGTRRNSFARDHKATAGDHGQKPQHRLAHAPANVEAEQALLGALLYDNAAFERIGDNLQAEHFYEPFHQRLFAAIEPHPQGPAGRADPAGRAVRRDPAFEELGGVRYLADLVDRAPPAANAPDYARRLRPGLRRDLIRIGGEISRPMAQRRRRRPLRPRPDRAGRAAALRARRDGGVSQGFVLRRRPHRRRRDGRRGRTAATAACRASPPA
jgi:hypothetical protein